MTTVGIDLGGSGSRIATADGGVAASGPPFAVVGGRANHADVVRTLLRSVPTQGNKVAAVAVGAAGVVSLGDPAAIRQAVTETWPEATVVVASDAVTAVAGTWGEQGGAVVAAGTGVVAFGTDFADEWVRSDGWGHLVGDDGGAAWIGARGLAAGLREFDGRRGGSSAMLEALRRGHGEPTDLCEALRAAANPATMLASFAPAVTRAAADGDEVARAIVEAAARELAETGLSVVDGSFPPRLALVGGLATEPLIAVAFEAHVRARRADLTVRIGCGTPLDGALLLARKAAESTLSPHSPYVSLYPPLTSHNPRGES